MPYFKYSIEKSRFLKIFVFILFLCAVISAQDSKTISSLEVKYRRQIFKNERFSIYLLEIPPNHASLMHKHETDLLTVFFAGGETKSTIYGKSPKEDRFAVGEVRFRSAGFTHSTENIGTDMFRAVIFEFASSMGTVNSTKPDDSLYCNAGSETVCVDEKYILCTDKMCVQEINIAPNAIWRNSESAKDQMLVAVSDYKLSSQIIKSKKVLKRKSGEVEYFSGGTAGQWKNIAKNSARFIVVLFR